MYKERQELILKRTFHRLISYSLTLVCLLTILAVPGRAANILYSDVPQDAWYMDGVEYVTKNGIMAGTGKGKIRVRAVTSIETANAIAAISAYSPIPWLIII